MVGNPVQSLGHGVAIGPRRSRTVDQESGLGIEMRGED